MQRRTYDERERRERGPQVERGGVHQESHREEGRKRGIKRTTERENHTHTQREDHTHIHTHAERGPHPPQRKSITERITEKARAW
jgi:hypothetical protein